MLFYGPALHDSRLCDQVGLCVCLLAVPLSDHFEDLEDDEAQISTDHCHDKVYHPGANYGLCVRVTHEVSQCKHQVVHN